MLQIDFFELLLLPFIKFCYILKLLLLVSLFFIHLHIYNMYEHLYL